MRRSICYCEPSIALAGEVKSWKFVYTTSTNLPKGTKLKFNLASEGRIIDWEIPTADPKASENVIYGVIGSKTIFPEEIEREDSYVPDFEFTLPSAIKSGDDFAIVIGTQKNKGKAKAAVGNMAQTYSQRRRPFYLYIDPKGKGKYDEPEIFTLDIKGNTLHTIKIMVPSFVNRNRRFDAIVRFEDEHGNLTANAPEDTLIDLTHEHLRENLNWKLFLPETGFITLPNLYFNEEGVYTLRLLNQKTKETFCSPPIRCFQEREGQLLWGTLHGESERVDATENIDTCLRHLRDDQGQHFFASSPFEAQEETTSEIWKLVSNNIGEFNEDDRFTTYLGFQWVGAPKTEGVRQLIYSKDNKSILKNKDTKFSSLKKIYKNFTPKELLSIPCFSMGKGFEFDFSQYDPEFERVVEVYNSWGSSECTAKEGNAFPVTIDGKKGISESPAGSIRKALENNCRFGFIAGGLDDRGIYEDFFDSDQVQYTPGMTAVIAKTHTRDGILEALYNRSCYATTGERIIVGLYIIGTPMGQELNTGDKPGLMVNRHITGYVAGTTKINRVELICNGEIIQTFVADDYWLDFAYDDMRPLDKIAFKAKDKKPPFAYYYIRAFQEDGHAAWSSPIWIDILPPKPKEPSKLPPRPPKKPEPVIDMMGKDEDEEEDNEESEE